MHLLAGLAADGVTIVMVTHSRECATFARRIIHMSDGQIADEEVVLREAGVPAA
jgi:putative ABC transport system ATP-binding protein